VFAGSGGLKYRVASVAGKQKQGVTKKIEDVYKRCGMKMSQLQEPAVIHCEVCFSPKHFCDVLQSTQ
jgi:hypothetical protein